MTNNDIVTELCNNNSIKDICSKFSKSIHFNVEDLEQHIYLILLEMSNKKLNELYNNNELFYYIYYIIKAQATSPTSSFNKLYSNYKLDINYNIDITNSSIEKYDYEE